MKKVGINSLLCILLVVLLCACNGSPVEQNEEIVELSTWHFTSGVPNHEIKVVSSDSNTKFDLRVDGGAIWVYEQQEYLTSATVDNGTTVYWQRQAEKIETTYVDVIAKVDNNIVGYAVIKIEKRPEGDYNATIVKSVTFPTVNGNYQKVTTKQVEEKIKEAKK